MAKYDLQSFLTVSLVRKLLFELVPPSDIWCLYMPVTLIFTTLLWILLSVKYCCFASLMISFDHFITQTYYPFKWTHLLLFLIFWAILLPVILKTELDPFPVSFSYLLHRRLFFFFQQDSSRFVTSSLTYPSMSRGSRPGQPPLEHRWGGCYKPAWRDDPSRHGPEWEHCLVLWRDCHDSLPLERVPDWDGNYGFGSVEADSSDQEIVS